MNWTEIVGLTVAWGIMFLGVIGCVVPALPGSPLVFAGALAHRLWFGAAGSASLWVLVVLFLLMLFSLLVDFLASMYGAKRLGASRNGVIGAVVGGIVGFLTFNPIVMLIGPFLGAFAGELIGGRDWKTSGRAGLGATLGLLGGAIGKIACSVAMAGLFTVNVLWKLLSDAG